MGEALLFGFVSFFGFTAAEYVYAETQEHIEVKQEQTTNNNPPQGEIVIRTETGPVLSITKLGDSNE